MKTIFNNRIGTLLLAAALLLTPMAARAQGSTVEVTSVDNYGGNSNVTTNKPNETVTVTELDADHKPVRSWTGKTDGTGKITIPAGSNLSKPYLRVALADPKMAEFVTPSEIRANEPFTFAASGVVEGEVIDVKTVEGEVVATKKPDKYGRVFLPAGLAAGAYLISANHGNSSRLCNMVVAPPQGSADVLDMSTPILPSTEHGTINVPNSGNAMGLTNTIGGHEVPVLAANSHQIVTAAPADFGVKPGETSYSVVDKASGNALQSGRAVVYSASAKLTQVKVLSGTETHLILTVEPKSIAGTATAHVLSGPVTFSNGANDMSLPVENGRAEFPVQSQAGSNGQFQLGWSFDPIKGAKEALDWAGRKIREAIEGLGSGAQGGGAKGGGLNGGGLNGGGAIGGGAKGGDTKALDDDGWVKFKDDDGRTGRKKIIQSGEGFKQEAKVYDDGTTVTTTERTGQKRKTVETETSSTRSGERVVVTETMEYEPDGKGGWKPKSGKRVTKKIVGGKSTESTETWSPTAGWH